MKTKKKILLFFILLLKFRLSHCARTSDNVQFLFVVFVFFFFVYLSFVPKFLLCIFKSRAIHQINRAQMMISSVLYRFMFLKFLRWAIPFCILFLFHFPDYFICYTQYVAEINLEIANIAHVCTDGFLFRMILILRSGLFVVFHFRLYVQRKREKKEVSVPLCVCVCVCLLQIHLYIVTTDYNSNFFLSQKLASNKR